MVLRDKTFVSNGAAYNKGKLFFVSVLALVTGGMVFSIRASIMSDLEGFFTGTQAAQSAYLLGSAVGAAFLGLAIANLVGGPLCDFVGMGRLLGVASLLHLGGAATIIYTLPISQKIPVFWVLWIGMMSVGLAHGLIEAVINPLIATLYPDDKTHKLNVLHAWWPGGLIIGGLIAVGLSGLGVGWQIKQAVIILPAIVYGIMAITTKFPATERVAAGVSTKAMFTEALKPLFIIWWICMWFTATTELTTGSWIDAFLRNTVGMQGVLLLVYWSALMFVGRHFAGGLAHRLSPVGLMWFSSLLAGIGLLILSVANSPLTGILAATVFGIGICYMWPTMLAVASEQFPKGGAFIMGLMGTAGNLSILFTMPALGRIFDHYKVAIAKDMGTTFQNPVVLQKAASASFQWTAVLPGILIVIFGALWLRDKARGGYKAVKLTKEAGSETEAEKVKV